MNWKISQIEISCFKAFKKVHLDLRNASLLTLDGPNGYGKTSIFDAIELLLTGQIKRIHNLFSTLMTKNKSNYEDSLLWNTRSGKKDLSIKIEFIDGERKLVLARHAPAKVFSTKTNNRADKFKHFILYELPHFNSTEYITQNQREEHYLESIFGKNFRENFAFLNYLVQGQNQLLHTRVDERKDALGSLFNINDIKKEIENCKSAASKLTKFIGDDKRKAEMEALTEEGASLREMVKADLGNIEYKKLSTAEPQPAWDKETLFPIYSTEIHNQYIEAIRKINELLPLKSAIRIREKNDAIESYIEKNKESLKNLAQFGSDFTKHDALDSIKKEMDQLSQATAIIRRGATVIKLDEARTLPSWAPTRLEWFEQQIIIRNDLQNKNNLNDNVAVELARLKAQLLEEHTKLYPDDKLCPLCGADWETHDSMIKAIDSRAQIIADVLSEAGQALVTLITSMTNELSIIENNIKNREVILAVAYNSALHKALSQVKARQPIISQLADRLKTDGIEINFTFSENEEVISARHEELSTLLRAKKEIETEPLPDDWKDVINTAFKDSQDFYIIDTQELKNKHLYVTIKANESQNVRLQRCLGDLRKIQRENEAALKAKEKINKLRTTLENAEQNYADQTISEIELIFHIYSGRLIQNYQRGLGLFIESRDGKQLRFLTAEKSDHDAVMSMSSGQVSALSLAFFLALNKVYARVPLILIDDPSQSLDEINVASLTDLLRCELKHCQLIISSHEEDISAYMRYRFTRAGLSTNSLNMQRLAKELVNPLT